MGLVVPFNGDIELVKSLNPEHVSSVYGRENSSSDGGGRASQNNWIDRETLEEAIRLCHEKGITFDYILNMPMLEGKDSSRKGNVELDRKFEWIEGIGTDLVIVTSPYLLKKYKGRTNLRFGVSKFARVRGLQKFKQFVDMGADRVCLDLSLTRDFETLSAMQKTAPGKIQLLANDSCLFDCAKEHEHAYTSTWASIGDRSQDYTHHCSYWCLSQFTANPNEIVKSTFIRPEDLAVYREIGIDSFKLIDRNKPTTWIKNVIGAYEAGRYDGNLADLFSLFSWFGQEAVSISELEKLAEKRISTIEEVKNIRRKVPAMLAMQIDNREMDGYLDLFRNGDCTQLCADPCKYCADLAERAAYIDPQRKGLVARVLGNVQAAIYSGDLQYQARD